MILVAKIVDDVLLIGEPTHVQSLLATFNSKFSFGTVAHGPGYLRLYGMNVVHKTDKTCPINANDKLLEL